jgi:hypothetical protein
MPRLTPHERSLVTAELAKQPFAASCTNEEIERALRSAVEVFSDFEQKFVPGFSCVVLRCGGGQRLADFVRELVPALVYAHRFFGEILPQGLKQKLSNATQTHDTLFELMCLGAFQPHHKIRYEPKLEDGKVPDLMLCLPEQAVYVECKCQNITDSEHQRRFARATAKIHQFLDVDQSEFVKQAWAEDLRIEVRLSRAPSEADLRELKQVLDKHTPTAGTAPIAFGHAGVLSLVARNVGFDDTLPPPACVIRVETTGTDVHYRNVHSAVYPWPGLAASCRQSQRRLLTDARRTLRSMPASAYGLVCIQTISSKRFEPDIHKLLLQKEYERIPIVWLNPIGAGKIICRNDAIMLREQICGPILVAARDKAARKSTRSS